MNICMNLKKEEPKKITTTKELAQYILESGNDVEKMSEEDRSRMDAQITAKLQSGKKLSQKEMDYLRKTNPIMYAHALRVQRMAEAVEEQLKHAKSKEEADRIISSALSGISKNDPDREYIFAAVNRISTEFHKSGAYEKLPNTVEEGDKEGKESGDIFSDADDKEDDGFDLKNWSPLREVYANIFCRSVNVSRVSGMENGRSYDEVVDKAVEVVNSGITQRPDFDIDSLGEIKVCGAFCAFCGACRW